MLSAPLEQINNLASADKAPNQEALRQAARQFEAILLMQLTSALNGAGSSGGDDEDSLFGGDGGTEMAKKMFSEQLATTMSESGGVGLADMMMQKFGAGPKAVSAGSDNYGLTKPISAVKAIRSSAPSFKEEAAPAFQRPASQTNLSQMTTDQIMQIRPEENSQFMPDYESFRNAENGKFITVDDRPAARNSGEVEIISTYENENSAEKDEALKNPVLDGQVLNSTRARIVPNAPISEDGMSPAAPVDHSPAGDRVNYEMPVRGRVSSNFGMRFHPIDKIMKFHAGLDLAVPVGTPVSSAADGVVTFAGRKDGYGNVVIVQHHDGRETRYGHLSKINVAENERVSGGQQIALSGTTGKSTGPHLHFEVRENGEAVNPLKFVPKVLR